MIEWDRIRGFILIIIAIFVFSIYVYILFATTLDILLIKITVLSIVGIIFFIVGWIGVTLSLNEKKLNE